MRKNHHFYKADSVNYRRLLGVNKVVIKETGDWSPNSSDIYIVEFYFSGRRKTEIYYTEGMDNAVEITQRIDKMYTLDIIIDDTIK